MQNVRARPSVGAQFRRILQDPILAVALVGSVIFVGLTIILPLLAMIGESVSTEGAVKFRDYLGSPVYQTIISNTLVMGVVVGAVGTLVGFLFAFVQVKLDVPFKRFMHVMALLPVISDSQLSESVADRMTPI